MATRTLIVTFYEYPGGPAADVTGLQITITATGGGDPIVGPTAGGVTHPATGVYTCPWDDSSADPGEYLVLWSASSGGDPVQATEIVTVSAEATWPPTLAELKTDRKIEPDDTRDDSRLTQVLDAAVAYVQRVHKSRYNFTVDPATLPVPGADMHLGTIRLASRWHTRGRSPDGLVEMGELGSARVSSGDVDIDRLLRIGRFAPMVVA